MFSQYIYFIKTVGYTVSALGRKENYKVYILVIRLVSKTTFEGLLRDAQVLWWINLVVYVCW